MKYNFPAFQVEEHLFYFPPYSFLAARVWLRRCLSKTSWIEDEMLKMFFYYACVYPISMSGTFWEVSTVPLGTVRYPPKAVPRLPPTPTLIPLDTK
jgi:hypothetical protein